MPTITVNERLVRANNPLQSAGRNIPANTSFHMQLTSSEWDDPTRAGIIVTMTVERSTNGGSTWAHNASATCTVGRRGKNGELPSFEFDFGGAANVQGRIRVEVTDDVRLGAQFTVN